jgi:hypothetical protein
MPASPRPAPVSAVLPRPPGQELAKERAAVARALRRPPAAKGPPGAVGPLAGRAAGRPPAGGPPAGWLRAAVQEPTGLGERAGWRVRTAPAAAGRQRAVEPRVVGEGLGASAKVLDPHGGPPGAARARGRAPGVRALMNVVRARGRAGLARTSTAVARLTAARGPARRPHGVVGHGRPPARVARMMIAGHLGVGRRRAAGSWGGTVRPTEGPRRPRAGLRSGTGRQIVDPRDPRAGVRRGGTARPHAARTSLGNVRLGAGVSRRWAGMLTSWLRRMRRRFPRC